MRKILAVVALMGSALTACSDAPVERGDGGTGDRSPDSLAMLRSAPRRTLDSTSMRMTFAFSLEAEGQRFGMTGSAEFLFADEPEDAQAHFRIEYSGSVSQMAGGTMEMVVDRGPVIYMTSDLFGSFLPVETPWIKMDASGLEGGWPGIDSITGTETDPSSTFGFLWGAVDAEEVGPETLDGTPTTHFRVTVDLNEALAEVPASQRRHLRAAIRELRAQAGADLSEIPMDVWIADDGTLKRLTYDLSLDGLEGVEGAVSISAEMTVTDIGARFRIEPPPADQVTDLSEHFTDLWSGLGADTEAWSYETVVPG